MATIPSFQVNKLSAAKARTAEAGRYGDGNGLWLFKRNVSHGKWVLNVTVHGRRREMGLGPFPDVSLKEAREDCLKWRRLAQQGIDPIKERERLRRVSKRNMHVLRDVARDAFESRKAELKGDGKAGRWFSPIELHILPKLGDVPVADIDQLDIRNTLAPIWHDKAATARKAINRLSVCMRHAAALGLDVDLQAVNKAQELLGKQRHVVTHIPALKWQDVPTFYSSLDEGTVTHLALRLLMLTAVRSKPLRFMHEDQLDGEAWTIPSEDMKGRKGATTEFRVPLSGEAMDVIAEARRSARDGFLFPSVRKGVISDATMSRLMERRGITERPHGFRSSFRDWVEEKTSTPYEVAETAMGHTVGGRVERAYRRTDYFDQRRVLMQRWADFVAAKKAEVVRIGSVV